MKEYIIAAMILAFTLSAGHAQEWYEVAGVLTMAMGIGTRLI